MKSGFNRRSLLRGILNGTAVVVALPTLDMFLDGNGKAYADGTALPTRFGTYFWGLGLTPSRWVPKTIGKDYELMPDIQSLNGLQKKVSVLSGFRVGLDGQPNQVHWSGIAGILSGMAPSTRVTFDAPSFDVAAAQEIGGGTRFRSIQLTPFGDPSYSYSTPTGQSFNTPESTPLELYNRLFGEGFQDPNGPNWAPDPNVILRRSVLSAVSEQRKGLMATVGAADQATLDQYFTSVREMEDQLATELVRPARCDACVVPKGPPASEKPSGRIDVVNQNNKLMADLMAMALACNQTKVFSVVFTKGPSEAYLAGDEIYHLHTHDEPVDDKLGYQPISSQLAELSFRGYTDFLRSLDQIKEGDGTLLDHSLVMGLSDTGYAMIHSLDNIPMFLGGGANGRHKSGQHIAGTGDQVTRVALTAQQLAGMTIGEFGTGSMKTAKPVSELIA